MGLALGVACELQAELTLRQTAQPPSADAPVDRVVRVEIAYDTPPAALGLAVSLPNGWSYAGGVDEPEIKPVPQETGELGWTWLNPPLARAEFSYVIRRAEEGSDEPSLSGHVWHRQAGQLAEVEAPVVYPLLRAISSVEGEQITDGSGRIRITYALDIKEPGVAGISLVLSQDGGATFDLTPAAATLSHDGTDSFEGVKQGPHQIVWDALGTLPVDAFNANLVARIVAESDRFAVTNQSPVFSVDLRGRSGGLTITGTVRDAAMPSVGLAGATVQMAGRSAVTGPDGRFTLTDVALVNGTALAVSREGFDAVNFPPTVLPGHLSADTGDLYLSRGLSVVSLRPAYDGLFIAGLAFLNPYTATVNWGEKTPGWVEFFVNGRREATVPTATAQAEAKLNMGSELLVGSLRVGANTIAAVAVAADQSRSVAREIPVSIIPLPLPVEGQITLALLEMLPGRGPAVRLRFQIPPARSSAAPFALTDPAAAIPIPYLGGIHWGLSGTGEFSYEFLQGKWTLSAGTRLTRPLSDLRLIPIPGGTPPQLTLRQPDVKWSDLSSTIDLTLRGSGVASQTRGIEIDRIGVGLALNVEQPVLVVYVLDLVPGTQVLHVLDVLRIIGVDLNSVQRLGVNGVAGLAGEFMWNYSTGQYEETVLTPKCGARAYYSPNLLVARLDLSLTGTFEYPMRFADTFSWKANAQLLFRMYAELRGLVVLDVGYVLLNGTFAQYPPEPATGRAGQVRLAALDAGAFAVAEGSAPSQSPRPISRDYLRQGVESFVARETRGGQASDADPSALDRFRGLSATPALKEEPTARRRGGQSNRGAARVAGPGSPGGMPPQADLTLVRNVYPTSQPALAQRANRLLLLYVADPGTAPDLQRTDIHWTLWDGVKWSEPAPILQDPRAEFAPQVAFDGSGNAVAVWERVADADFNQMDLDALAAQLEIVWARWDAGTGQWSAPAALTQNNDLDHTPLLCGPMADGGLWLVWTKNEQNRFMGSGAAGAPENDQVLVARWDAIQQAWGAPQRLIGNLRHRRSHSLAGSGNQAVYAWTADVEGTATNATEQALFYCEDQGGVWSAPRQHRASVLPAEPRDAGDAVESCQSVRAVISPEGDVSLCWVQGADLVMDENFSGTARVVRADSNTASFADYVFTLGPASDRVLVWQEPSEDGSDTHYRVYDSGAEVWGQDQSFFQDDALERSLAAVWDEAGHLTLAYSKVEISRTNQTFTFENGQTVTVTNVPRAGRVDLVVTKRALVRDVALGPGDFTVEGRNYLPGDPLTLAARVRNAGDLAVSNVVVAFYRGDPAASGVRLTNATVSGWLEGGASATVSHRWVIPEPAGPQVLYAVVDPDQSISEWPGRETNNTQSVHLGGVDLCASLVSQRVDTNGAFRVVAQVMNVGAPTASGTSLVLRRQTEPAATLATAAVPALDPGASAQAVLELPPGTQPEGETLYVLSVDEAGLTPDVDRQNNTVTFAVTLWLDSDRDGMPDGWEHAHGLNASDPGDAQQDADGDGVDNRGEYLSGTDPHDPQSYLLIAAITVSGEGARSGVRLIWGSVASRLYTLEQTPALGREFAPVARHLLATPPGNTYLDTSNTNAEAGYYRLRLE